MTFATEDTHLPRRAVPGEITEKNLKENGFTTEGTKKRKKGAIGIIWVFKKRT